MRPNGHTFSRRFGVTTALSVLVAILLAVGLAPWSHHGPVAGSASPGTLVATAQVSAQPSPSRVEQRTLFSDSLQREMHVNVYVPPGYDTSPMQSYAVLYMLHGLDGDENVWKACGLFKAADEATARGDIPPLIIVTPAGDNGYWVDQANNGPRYGTYVAKDVVHFVDDSYRTIPARESRAIGGMSMGGHGALQLAMNFPNTFGVVGAHSVALRTYEQAFSFFGDRSYFRGHDPVQLFKDYQARAKYFRIWIDIGTDDQWYSAASAFNTELSAENIPHEWHAYAGSHDAQYWSAHVADYLAFYGRSLVTNPSVSYEYALTVIP